MTDPLDQLMDALARYERNGGTMPNDQQPLLWLTQQQVADRLQCSIRTVERLRGSGRLRTYRATPGADPRFRAQDVDGLMQPDTSTTP